ncbi:hypothetical protein ACLKA7_001759, partial [Drosophila subpalustris]
MVRIWIYNLKREELLQYGSEFKIELTGTVDAMRKEFGERIGKEAREKFSIQDTRHSHRKPKMNFASTSEEARRLEDQKREERRASWGTSSTFPQNQTNTDNRTNLERNQDYAAVAKQVREW